MIIDFKNKRNFYKINNLSNLRYDFIIIGSGPAAVTLYKKIISIKKKTKLLMIERGDFINNSYKKVYTNKFPIKLESRVFGVGGTSNAWSNISSYFEKFEMISRWSHNRYLWPLNYKDLIKNYKELQKILGFDFQKIKQLNLNIPFTVRKFIGAVNPTNFKNLINSDEIDLLYNCEVDTIDENNKCAFINILNNKISFKAKKLIICCGGIETVKLIKHSIKKKKLSLIKNKHMIGKCFMDHPKISLGYLLYPKLSILSKIEFKKENKHFHYAGISLKQNEQIKKKLLNSYIRFEKSNGNQNDIINILSNKLINKIFNYKRKIIYKLRLFCEMSPSENNRIIFKNNKTYIQYKFNKVEYETIKLLVERVKMYFSTNPEKEINLKFSKKQIDNNILDASHHMGGLNFNKSVKKTNIDKNLKLIGLKKIYACSSAIFPSSGSVNPTMTICALANRLGKHLTKN